MKLPILITCLALNSLSISANTISQQQVTKDVSILADDNMAGRASFTAGSKKAANYIAQRFKQIGLSPLAGLNDFKQSFQLFQIEVEKTEINLNGTKVPSENSLLFTRYEELNWSTKTALRTVKIGAEDNFRSALAEVNQLKENVVVLIDSSHTEIFSRYHQHFNRPQNKFEINQGPSALLLLTNDTNVENITLTASSKVQKRSLTNVVGVLPGKKKADEIVLFSAHYDHLGDHSNQQNKTNEKQSIDLIYNGADDNASGTSAVINLAEYYRNNNNNQRSLVFVAFAAEELGGFGSKYFSEKLNPDKITAMLNIEMVGKPSKFGAGELWMTGAERSNLQSILNKNLQNNKQIFTDPYPKQRLFYRSDNATLARLGVPAHSFSSTQIDKDQHYHKVSDDLSSLDLSSMTKVIQSLAEASQTLVDGTDTPSRIDQKKVKSSGSFF